MQLDRSHPEPNNADQSILVCIRKHGQLYKFPVVDPHSFAASPHGHLDGKDLVLFESVSGGAPVIVYEDWMKMRKFKFLPL